MFFPITTAAGCTGRAPRVVSASRTPDYLSLGQLIYVRRCT